MAPRRISLRYSIAAALLTLLAAWATYHLKYEVRDREMRAGPPARRSWQHEREALQVARVDLDYLTRPDRLVVQAGELGMVPGRGARIVDADPHPARAAAPAGARAAGGRPALRCRGRADGEAFAGTRGGGGDRGRRHEPRPRPRQPERLLGPGRAAAPAGARRRLLRAWPSSAWRSGCSAWWTGTRAATLAVACSRLGQRRGLARSGRRAGGAGRDHRPQRRAAGDQPQRALGRRRTPRHPRQGRGGPPLRLGAARGRRQAAGRAPACPRPPPFAWVKHQITPEEQKAVLELGIPGIKFSYAAASASIRSRTWPATSSASSNVDNGGQFGIEKGMNDRLGQGAAKGPLALSLDMRVQQIVREELFSAFVRFTAAGCRRDRARRRDRRGAGDGQPAGLRPEPAGDRHPGPALLQPRHRRHLRAGLGVQGLQLGHGARFGRRVDARGGSMRPSRSRSAASRSTTTMR